MRGGHSVQDSGATPACQGAAAFDDAVTGFGAITSIRIVGRDGRHYALKPVRRNDGEVDGSTPSRALGA